MKSRAKSRNLESFSAALCLLVLSFLLMATSVACAGQAASDEKPVTGAQDAAVGTDVAMLIEPAELPSTYPHGRYHVQFHARGNYVPRLHWRVASGTLPPGIKLDEDGLLHGEAERAGEFQFVILVKDGGQPQQAVQKAFTIKVVEALTLAWQRTAHVAGNRIEGSVEVTNTTVDDMDLTFDVKAVAENGRATEIGYQHFVLTRGTVGMALPFGETLPPGAYLVYVNVNGEVARRNAIYKQQLQTPRRLHVVVGP